MELWEAEMTSGVSFFSSIAIHHTAAKLSHINLICILIVDHLYSEGTKSRVRFQIREPDQHVNWSCS